MDEAKRILRYSLPGMVYVILLLVTFVILKPSTAKDLLLNADISAGETLAALVFSGGLGYLFSIIYFGSYWIIADRSTLHIYNHLDVVNDLIISNKLIVVNPALDGSSESKFEVTDRRQAWYIVNVLWHSRTKKSKAIKGVSEKLDSYYSDITTSLATTLTSSVFSFITFLVLINKYYENVNCFNAFICVLIYVGIIVLVLYNFVRTYKAYQAMINTAFATEAFSFFEKGKAPLKIVFSR